MSPAPVSRVALPAYCARIGFDGALRPDLTTLASLHRAHLSAVPFENIDVRLGRAIALDLASLEEKIVRRRRGGYCFEQNTLFAAVLREIGFRVSTLEARVGSPTAPEPRPRTHMTLAVDLDGRRWLVDVGFGADGPLAPLPFQEGTDEKTQGHRLLRDAADRYVLQRRTGSGWLDLYAFAPSPALPIDFVVANHFTATHPSSPFVQTLTVQLSSPTVRRVLRGRTYTEHRESDERTRELSRGEVADLLAAEFGLKLSAEEIDRALG